MACKAFIFKVMQTKASDPVSVRDDAFFISVVFIRHAFLPPMKSLHFFPKKWDPSTKGKRTTTGVNCSID